MDLMFRRGGVLVLVAALTLAACQSAVSTGDLQGVAIDNPSEKGSFVLTDTEGESYDFVASTEGKLTLLYFGYLQCPDICPVHLAQIAEVLGQDAELARKTEVVFVSVDPDRDTPEAIREFLDRFDPSFVGLTGTHDELKVAQEAVGVPPARIFGEGDDYTVDHAGWVIAYAPDGLSYSIYPFGTRQSEWNNDLQILAKIGEGQSS
ncbi:MAG: SCO family protein [Acidimicrobiia bacterium]